jgi:DNA polymerase III delta subunit
MIHFLIGENSFGLSRAVQKLVDAFDGRAERIDGSSLLLKDIPDLLMGNTLFADKRLVIIKGLSENGTVWVKLPEWFERLSDDIELVIVETKPDKRTSTFKALKSAAKFEEFLPWTERDGNLAETWIIEEVKKMDMTLDKKVAHLVVARVGVDQWQLLSALEKLSLADEVSPQTVEDLIDARPSENVFNLFETALKGDNKKVHSMIQTLELTEEPYKLFALLSSQAFQLAAVYAAEPSDNPAKDFAIHPFVVSKLSAHAKKQTRADISRIITAFADADADIKLSRGEPWLLIERALLQVGMKGKL